MSGILRRGKEEVGSGSKKRCRDDTFIVRCGQENLAKPARDGKLFWGVVNPQYNNSVPDIYIFVIGWLCIVTPSPLRFLLCRGGAAFHCGGSFVVKLELTYILNWRYVRHRRLWLYTVLLIVMQFDQLAQKF